VLLAFELQFTMSEYQFVHFIAIDRPLNDEQLKFMQRQSTRATVSRREFTNEYHYGDFHGKTLEMMRRGFDLHVNFANYGVRQLMFRLPHGFHGGDAIIMPYLIKHEIEWKRDEEGPGGVLSIAPQSDGGRWESYFHGLDELLEKLTPVREMLLVGDLRPLYLGWLACEPPDCPEPPVPVGLGSLPQALRGMADFYELSDDLLDAAAEESSSVDEPVATPLPVQAWLEKKSEKQRLLLIEKLLSDDSGIVRADILQKIKKTLKAATWPVRNTSRTMDDLYRLAEERYDVRSRQEKIAEEKRKKERLAVMAKDPDKTVASISKLVAMRSTAKYSEAVAVLCDLREALGPEMGPAFTSSVAAELRKAFPRTNGLVSRLKDKGFL
jgi:hypothetical protein